MYRDLRVGVVVPVLNEALSLPRVLEAIPDWVDRVVVADNGSTDASPAVARRQGALVVNEPRRGYGYACLAGLAAAGTSDVIVFLDGDYSDHPEEMGRLIDPLCDTGADLVIGSRVTGECEPGAMPLHQRLGNRFTTGLMAMLTGRRFTDLGPFRCIRTQRLLELSMQDNHYGWTVEMQLKAILTGLNVVEVPVRYRKRLGRSKISGHILASVAAGLGMNLRVLKVVCTHRAARR